MFEIIKNKIAHFILKRKYIKIKTSVTSFNQFFTKTRDCLILMPNDETDFNHSLNFLKFLISHGKQVSICLAEHKYSILPSKKDFNTITFGQEDFTKLKLPHNSFIQRIKDRSYDSVIDLSRSEDLFLIAVSLAVPAKFKIGFEKENSDKYYNFQVKNNKRNSEISYINLVNSLQMF